MLSTTLRSSSLSSLPLHSFKLKLKPHSFSSSSSHPQQQNHPLWSGLQTWRTTSLNPNRFWGPSGPQQPTKLQDYDDDDDIKTQLGTVNSLAEVGSLVLSTKDPLMKSRLSHFGFQRWVSEQMNVGVCVPPNKPARPAKPELVSPKEIPAPKDSGLPLNAYMLHNLAHVELNAIDLAWDTVVRFSPYHELLGDMFFADFARVADDESRHFAWCSQRLAELGFSYGDMPAHNLLWRECEKSSDDVVARLAVIPLVQEARGLDAGPRLVQKLIGFGDCRTLNIVAKIAEEEVAHVAVGVYWFIAVCQQMGRSPCPTFRDLLKEYNVEVKGPFNYTAREEAGLPRDWYDPLKESKQDKERLSEMVRVIHGHDGTMENVGIGLVEAKEARKVPKATRSQRHSLQTTLWRHKRDHAYDKARSMNLSDDIMPRVMPFVHRGIQDYGKIFFSWFGPMPTVHIIDPDVVREVLSRMNEFQKPKKSSHYIKILSTGVIEYEGDKWSKHRKILNPTFHAEKLKLMAPAMCLSCCEMIKKWEMLFLNEKSIELDVFPHLQTLTGDVISRTAFGSSYEEGVRIFDLQNELGSILMHAIQSLYIPGSRFIPSGRNKRMEEIDQEVKALIRCMIDNRMTAMEAGETGHDDLLGLMLKSNYDEIQTTGNKRSGMSIDEIIEECKLFYFAGHETVANLLVWTMILLSRYPEWQELAREEAYQVFGNNKPDIDGLNRLKILNMILLEVLRLYPGVSALYRMSTKETRVGGINLPEGTLIIMPILALHHDQDTWGEDALEFNPQRFSNGVSNATSNGQVSYFPFGGGPRICIGQNFAMLEAKIALVMILQRFSFVLSPSYSHAPQSIITLQPQFGAHLILEKLRPTQQANHAHK